MTHTRVAFVTKHLPHVTVTRMTKTAVHSLLLSCQLHHYTSYAIQC